MAVVTLLTDFGTLDEYVGAMKGVILSIAPRVTLVDISHEVPPQDVGRAAYLLEGYHRYFPEGTIHVVVVDPGVGASRAIVAVRTQACTFLVPDNGVLTRVIDDQALEVAVRVENRAFFLPHVSRTFHGRDIFAPVAAHLAAGADIHKLGPCIACDELVRLDIPPVVVTGEAEARGCVMTFDRFGNAVTNIDRRQLAALSGKGELEVRLGGRCIVGLSPNYAGVPPGQALALVGSRGYLEIGINCGSAREVLGLAVGDPVHVRALPSRPPL